MEDKFKNRYRLKSARKPHWDYSWRGRYFVTICTRGRAGYFGKINDGKMLLSKIGEIVKSEWLKSPEIRSDMNLELDEYVIMPDHFHGIIQIGENEYNKYDNENITNYGCRRDAMHGVSTTDINAESLQKGKNNLGPQRKNLSSIIRGFKSAVTRDSRKVNPDFEWQSRFYDHVIRNEKSLKNIRRYIKDNPINWTADEFNPESKTDHKKKNRND